MPIFQNGAFRPRCLVVAAAVLVASPAVRGSDYDVIINEIHYNPLGGAATALLEYVELVNLGASPVDLGGWSFTEGISYTCPPGLVISPNEHLVFSPDPAAARAAYGIARAAGPYSGRLDNNGEILALTNGAGQLISRLHYVDDGVWSSLPDGNGPSLEFTGEDNWNDLPARWAPSLLLGGSPAARNSRYEPPPLPLEDTLEVIVPRDGTWRTFKGTSAPSNPVTAWTTAGFPDAAWPQLGGAFGYGDDHGFAYATTLSDMMGSYTTFYIRHSFELDGPTHADLISGKKRLRLLVTHDDAFVAYANGVEVGRRNVGTPGTPVSFNSQADSSDAAAADLPLGAFNGSLQVGTNIVAVQGVNFFIVGRDFFLGADLGIETLPVPGPEEDEDDALKGAINEVRPGAGGPSPGFVELFNPTAETLDLGGHILRLGSGPSFTVPAGTALIPGGFRHFLSSALGFAVPAAEETYVLLRPDGRTFADALQVAPVGAATSSGRFPDGNEDVFVMAGPTPGLANQYSFVSPVVINEIHFHPPYVPPGGGCTIDCSDGSQWIELWNRGASEADLTGWSLSKGVSFSFAPGTKVPAGGAIVVAASAATFRTAHPAIANVAGDWSGRLSHESDTINLRDALGNRVDHVRYGDGGSTNDDEPEDGLDDRTFRGSEWPPGADGTGRTLELVHPSLENKFGLAWRASAGQGGTPGAANSTFDATPPPVVSEARHDPPVPRSNEDVTVTCRIPSASPIVAASVSWSLDGGAPGTATLRDDGVAPDETAGDGRFATTIPAQAGGSVVRFRITALDQDGGTTTVPAGPQVPPYAGFEGPFYLYEVDDGFPPANGIPSYRIILTQADLEELQDRDVQSNVLLPGTFIAGDEVRYGVGVRYRGENSRNEPNRSYRVNFPGEAPFEGTDHLNLNASNDGNLGISGAREVLAADLFRRAGAPYPQVFPINLRFRGEVARAFDSRYVRKENFDDDFLDRFYGGSDAGNLYRARNPVFGGPSGDLRYLGEDPGSYRDFYEKKSNEEEDDYSDIIGLTRVFDPVQTPDAIFVDEVETWIDARQWAQYFALQALLTNNDGGIWNNSGEDYFLYRVPDDSSRPDGSKVVILPWDVEETFTDAGQRLFVPSLAAVRRFLGHPHFARLYYQELASLRQGVFSRLEMRRRYGFISAMYPAADVYNVVDPIDTYVTDRIGYVDANVNAPLLAGPINPGATGTPVIEPGDLWKFFRGSQQPSGGPFAWAGRNYADNAWEEGPTGIGYGDGDDQTPLDDMQGAYTTVFARKTFPVDDPNAVVGLTLAIDYDDAFVAYVNGVEVARSPNAPDAPEDPVPFDAVATMTHEVGNVENFDIPVVPGLLVAGNNVLAVVTINERADSTDLSFIPALFLSTTGSQSSIAGGCGGMLYATGSEVMLGGLADPAKIAAIRVNGGAAAVFAYITSGPGPFGAVWTVQVPIGPGDSRFLVTGHPDLAGLEPPVESVEVIVRKLDRGFTSVSGNLPGDTNWTAAAGPYRLTGTVQVPAGATLRIEPGTVVLGGGGAAIRVLGRIEALGTEAQPIHLGAFTCDNFWGGIVMLDTGTSDSAPTHVLRRAILEHGASAQGAGGFVAPVNSKLLIDGCTFRSLGANAVDGTDARVEVHGSVFEEIYEGVHCTGSFTVIEDSIFRRMIGDSDAIDFDATTGGRSRIERCRIEAGSDDGIDLATASVDIRGNVFFDVADKAISLEGNGMDGAPALTGNIIYASGTGMALKDGVTPTGDHNTIFACQEGIRLFARDAGPDGGHGDLHSMIIWNNIADVLLDSKSTLALAFSDVGGGVWPGAGNISSSPKFMAPAAGDFALAPGSPCIGTGMAGTDMGAVPSGGPATTLVRGDANESGRVDISDAIVTLGFLFLGGLPPRCHDTMDANDDGKLNITDAVYVLAHLFQGGPILPPPYPEPGVDPTFDPLECP